jgi:hypothetical protein
VSPYSVSKRKRTECPRLATTAMALTTLESLGYDMLYEIILRGDGIAFSRLLKTARFFHMLPICHKKTWTELAFLHFPTVRTILKHAPPYDANAAKLLYVEQYRARIFDTNRYHYPDISDYLIVCNVFCGDDLLVSFDSTAPFRNVVNPKSYSYEWPFSTDIPCSYNFTNPDWHAQDKVKNMIEELNDIPVIYNTSILYNTYVPPLLGFDLTESNMVCALNCTISITRLSDWKTTHKCESFVEHVIEVDNTGKPKKMSIQFQLISPAFPDPDDYETDYFMIDPWFTVDLEDYAQSKFSFSIKDVKYNVVEQHYFEKGLFLEMAIRSNGAPH